ncbi:MAG: hypothetical protein M1820_006077 [Bogoriella megaspora]|nr:MAG: hypothetical protein M1820_006077 [Bogoriella megaspora]
MLRASLRCRSRATSTWKRIVCHHRRRGLTTLAIETSCDDTSVALLEYHPPGDPLALEDHSPAFLHFHDKITADNAAYRGIHPIVSLESHQANLGELVHRALRSRFRTPEPSHLLDAIELRDVLPFGLATIPDFISVTRGPGMRSNLSAGLDFAKGLSVAWQRPLVGVHHMQAHALTPRLASMLEAKKPGDAFKQTRADREIDAVRRLQPAPNFPFLSLLVSGGHTLLIRSDSLTEHTVMATTTDIAIGDFIDKVARVVLPPEVIEASKTTMFGPLLEKLAFPNGAEEFEYYEAPKSREQELGRRMTKWGWGFAPPLGLTKGGHKSWNMEFSFSGLCSSAIRFVKGESLEHVRNGNISEEERRDLAREAMRVGFEHLASRVTIGLTSIRDQDPDMAGNMTALVVSGGVAANGFLKKVMRAFLDAKGYQHIELVFPPIALCTDNAAMIGWAGMEMYRAGWETNLSCHALRKWTMDPKAKDGGILGVGGWKKHNRNFDL